MKFASKVGPLAVLILAPALSGCLAAAAATAAAGVVGVVKYEKNKVLRDFERPFDEVWKATLETRAEFDYPEPKESWRTKTEGELEGGDLWVRVERHPEEFTRVCVRIGTFDTADHRRRAGLFLNELTRRLVD